MRDVISGFTSSNFSTADKLKLPVIVLILPSESGILRHAYLVCDMDPTIFFMMESGNAWYLLGVSLRTDFPGAGRSHEVHMIWYHSGFSQLCPQGLGLSLKDQSEHVPMPDDSASRHRETETDRESPAAHHFEAVPP